jgi:hypothetical protein
MFWNHVRRHWKLSVALSLPLLALTAAGSALEVITLLAFYESRLFFLFPPLPFARCSGERSQWHYCTRVPNNNSSQDDDIMRLPTSIPLVPRSSLAARNFETRYFLLAWAHFSPVCVSPKAPMSQFLLILRACVTLTNAKRTDARIGAFSAACALAKDGHARLSSPLAQRWPA